MRFTRAISLGVLLAFLVWTLHGGVQAQQSGNTTRSQKIKSAGCVLKGVEAGCLVLTGFEDKKQYNLFFPSGKKPEVATAISFEGTKHSGPTPCMQGIAVDVAKWTQLKMKCPKEPPTPITDNPHIAIKGIGVSKAEDEMRKSCTGVIASVEKGPVFPCSNCASQYPVGSSKKFYCEDSTCPLNTRQKFDVDCSEPGNNSMRGCTVTFSSVDLECKIR